MTDAPISFSPTQLKRRAAYALLEKSLKPNIGSHFCTPFARHANGINTESRLDKDKTQAIQWASI